MTSALRELGKHEAGISFGEASNAVHLSNLALMTSEPLAQMVLCFSALDELGQNQNWNETQKELIKELALAAEGASKGTAPERTEVAEAIRKGLFQLSLRQGVQAAAVALQSRLRVGRVGSSLCHQKRSLPRDGSPV